MRVVDIGRFENSVVIHFDTDDSRINAYTFASFRRRAGDVPLPVEPSAVAALWL